MSESKILLRQIEESDLGAIQALANSFAKIARFPFEHGGAQRWFDDLLKDQNSTFFLISAAKGGAAAYTVGLCGINTIDWISRHGRLFFAMLDRAKYKGTIQDFPSTSMALAKILEHGFKIGLNKIYVEIADNDASLGALEKAGFVVDGVSREAEFLDGQLRQSISLSITATEYELNNAGHSN